MRKTITGISTALLALALGACATSKSVDQKIAAAQSQIQADTNHTIESVASQVETIQQHQKEQDTQIQNLSREAKDALDRATQAGVLAKGKVAFQQTFGEDRIKFKTGRYELNTEAKQSLDEFAAKVKALTDPYYVEIQGHTDNKGGTRYNEDLGQRRAEEVRRYLSRQHGIALSRMSTISYGETLPVGSNKTKAGRSQNRRVVIVVLQ